MNSMSREISSGFTFSGNARDLWNEIKEQFEVYSDPRLYELQKNLYSVKQGGDFVVVYYNKRVKIEKEENAIMHTRSSSGGGQRPNFRRKEMQDKSHLKYSGASTHVCSHKILFAFVKSLSHPISINLSDNTIKIVQSIGNVQLSNHLELIDCLFLLAFKYNLLSDIRSHKALVVEIQENGLYVLSSKSFSSSMIQQHAHMTSISYLHPFPVINSVPVIHSLNKLNVKDSNGRVFDSLCFATCTAPHKIKFQTRSHPVVFIGYPPNQKGFRLYDLITKTVLISREVSFHERMFPYHSSSYCDLLSSLQNHDSKSCVPVDHSPTYSPKQDDASIPSANIESNPHVNDIDNLPVVHSESNDIVVSSDPSTSSYSDDISNTRQSSRIKILPI
ncbi:hypothetical protein LIER_39155 [Lithospermum erythrorhizon]|uniref:Retroviral polymerase SH3-like domain-containing protein n=1 Tax=Lithospermum erythrorhizon TaxID=34254 RepID=A0AAV3QAC3_LITER